MNGYKKNLKRLFPGLIFLLSVMSCSTIMEPEGDAAAKPMIKKLEQFKKDSGQYPESLMTLIPKYMMYYDFQAFIYKHIKAQGPELDDYIKKGLIPAGQGEGYKLTVRFHQYTSECTYINGQRKSCRYIGR